MKLLYSKDDFHFYKMSLDVRHKCEHKHNNEPAAYPCVVQSYRYVPDSKSPFTVDHEFFREENNTCFHCGNTLKGYPEFIQNKIRSGACNDNYMDYERSNNYKE